MATYIIGQLWNITLTLTLTLNSKWPPFLIQYLRDDPPPPHISSYKVWLKCM